MRCFSIILDFYTIEKFIYSSFYWYPICNGDAMLECTEPLNTRQSEKWKVAKCIVIAHIEFLTGMNSIGTHASTKAIDNSPIGIQFETLHFWLCPIFRCTAHSSMTSPLWRCHLFLRRVGFLSFSVDGELTWQVCQRHKGELINFPMV